MFLSGHSCYGVEEMMKPAVFRRNPRKAADDGQRRQDDQGADHHHWGFMHMLSGVMVQARAAIKSEVRQTEHIKRCQEGAECSHAIEHIMLMDERVAHDFVLAPEASQWRNSRDRNRSNQKEHVCPGNFRLQGAHLTDILLARQRMYDR